MKDIEKIIADFQAWGEEDNKSENISEKGKEADHE